MDQQQQINSFLEGTRWQCFNAFLDETERRIQIIEKRGYTKDEALRVLLLYAISGIEK